MTFWFWFGDKVLTNIRGEFVSWAEYDTLTTNKEK